MTKYSVPDDAWEDDEPEEPAEYERLVELDTHVISVKDRVSQHAQKDHTKYVEWRIAVEDGNVVGWALWQENETHVDSLPSPPPEDVPELIRRVVLSEMQWDSWQDRCDVPEFYYE